MGCGKDSRPPGRTRRIGAPRGARRSAARAARRRSRPTSPEESVVDDNRKVVGALSVVGATIVKIVSKFQYYFPDFLKKIRISVNQLGFPGIPAKFREIFTEK